MIISRKNYIYSESVYKTVSKLTKKVVLSDHEIQVFKHLNDISDKTSLKTRIKRAVIHVFKYIFISSYRSAYREALKLINKTHEKLKKSDTLIVNTSNMIWETIAAVHLQKNSKIHLQTQH